MPTRRRLRASGPTATREQLRLRARYDLEPSPCEPSVMVGIARNLRDGVPLHTEHLEQWCPAILRFLALPPGARFLVAGDDEDVWTDESLL